uniref:Putative monocarboxylate transporter ixodes scapularis monocarboxylate transporter n=1 Tax=Amblyomma triste TaxID=251400 RepID=A0A023G2Q9_AMBTT
MLDDVAIAQSKSALYHESSNIEISLQTPEPAAQKLLSTQTPDHTFIQPNKQSVGPSRLLTLWRKLFGRNCESQRNMPPIVGQFLSFAFAINALTCIVILFGLATFLLLSVDIAKDRGVQSSSAVFLMTAFAVGDLSMRAVTGLVIDARFLSLESVMFLGALLQAIAFELFVWLRTFSMMMVCSALIGASIGSRISLQAPALVKDFGIESLPLLLGGVFFCNGLALLSRPSLVGYCRDSLGSYDILLHLVVVSSIVLFFAWLFKYFSRRREQT